MEKIKVLIADDHQDYRRVVQNFLKKLPNIAVVGEANDGNEAIDQVRRLNPDVVLMDVAMPHMNGLEATRIIKEQRPDVKIFIATSHDDSFYRMQAIKAKADGFILKTSLKPALEAAFCVSSPAENIFADVPATVIK